MIGKWRCSSAVRAGERTKAIAPRPVRARSTSDAVLLLLSGSGLLVGHDHDSGLVLAGGARVDVLQAANDGPSGGAARILHRCWLPRRRARSEIRPGRLCGIDLGARVGSDEAIVFFRQPSRRRSPWHRRNCSTTRRWPMRRSCRCRRIRHRFGRYRRPCRNRQLRRGRNRNERSPVGRGGSWTSVRSRSSESEIEGLVQLGDRRRLQSFAGRARASNVASGWLRPVVMRASEPASRRGVFGG